jgi:hypothetical protein
MAKPDTLIVDGHAFSWQRLCELRRCSQQPRFDVMGLGDFGRKVRHQFISGALTGSAMMARLVNDAPQQTPFDN